MQLEEHPFDSMASQCAFETAKRGSLRALDIHLQQVNLMKARTFDHGIETDSLDATIVDGGDGGHTREAAVADSGGWSVEDNARVRVPRGGPHRFDVRESVAAHLAAPLRSQTRLRLDGHPAAPPPATPRP